MLWEVSVILLLSIVCARKSALVRHLSKEFDTMKQVLSKKSILTSSDFRKMFKFCTGASTMGLRAILMQTRGQQEISHAVSDQLSLTEQNYSVTEKVCYAIVWTVKQPRCYLFNN
ncbi:unnamed protein product [Lepidochelys kempii]